MYLFISGCENVPLGKMKRNQASMVAKNVRNALKDYFMTEEGSVNRQYSKIWFNLIFITKNDVLYNLICILNN